MMTGSTQEDYATDDAQGRPLGRRQSQQIGMRAKAGQGEAGKSAKRNPSPHKRRTVARIVAGVATSHIPAIGAAWDNGKTDEPYWQPVFKGFERSKEWIAKRKPDVCIVVYNDHMSAFSLEIVPTFALGCAAEFPIADEGWGPRTVPPVKGPSRARLAYRAVGHPRRVRPHHRQQDGGRSRPHRAAHPDVRPAQGNGRARSFRSPSTWWSIRCRPEIAATCWARRSARRSNPIRRTCAS